MNTRSILREKLRVKRRQTVAKHKRTLQLRLVKQAKQAFQHHRIALFYPLTEEIPVIPLINALRRLGKQIYLPVVAGNVLVFRRAPFHRGCYMQHTLGMLEPQFGYCLRAHQLDVIGMPLVGFDARLNRLGMGGGFYDRTLGARNSRRVRKIGLALEIQKAYKIPVESWDIKPHEIVTEKSRYKVS